MSELTWYSRLTIWVGAVILLAQSVFTGTQNVLTAVGVVALAGGLLTFTGALALEGRQVRLPVYVDEEEPAPTPTATVWEPPAELPAPRAAAATDAPGAREDTKSKEPPAVRHAERGARGIDVAPDSPLVGAVCVACQEPLRPGEVAAECLECQALQHAACWVGNRFHCARDGCGGHGPLEAPSAAAEGSGPSTA